MRIAFLLLFAPTVAFGQAYLKELHVDNLKLDGNTISTTNTNGHLVIDLNGLGKVEFPDLTANRLLVLDASKRLTSSAYDESLLSALTGLGSALCGIADTCTLTNKTLTAPVINSPTGILKADVGLGNVDNTSDATKNAAAVTLTNKTLTAPVINSPTGIVKGDVGLGNVDNTSDATKNAAAVTLTNKTIDGSNNTITNVSLTSGVTGNLPTSRLNGGTNATSSTFWRGDGTWTAPPSSATTTKGDLAGYDTTASRVPVGSDGQVLAADSTATLGVAWKFVAMPTGATTPYMGTTAPSGWLIANGSTIGNASSGGTARANADTEALFTLLWNQFTNTQLAIQTSAGGASTRGASASADFAANKRMPIPDLRGLFVRGAGSHGTMTTASGSVFTATFGNSQNDQFQGHAHTQQGIAVGGTTGSTQTNIGSGGGWFINPGSSSGIVTSAQTSDGSSGSPRGGGETRPANYALTYIVKL